MGVVNKVKTVLGGQSGSTEEDDAPSHRCPTCGEEYYTRPTVEIDTCRECGGTKVETL
jgi:YgiT-type zinc finger domain-containing protein